MKKILWILLLSLFPSVSFSQVQQIYVPGVGQRSAQGDIDGTQFTTERFPIQSLYSNLILTSGVAVNNNDSLTTIAFPNSNLYGMKIMGFSTTGASLAKFAIKFLGSWDGVTYQYVMDRYSLASGTFSVTDTLKILGTAAVPGTIGIPLAYSNGTPIPYPYLKVRYYNQNGAANTQTPVIEIYGRQF